MKAEEILTLVRAGFTRADLAALGAVQSADKPADKLEDVAPTVSQATAATLAQMPKTTMTGAAQPKTESVDDILAQIIAPNGGAK